MKYKEPTYEEYRKATRFGRFRYRFGVFIMFLVWLSFLFVIFYMVSTGEAIAKHPLTYGAEKFELYCTCQDIDGDTIYFNATDLWVEGSRQPNFIDINLSEKSKLNITN